MKYASEWLLSLVDFIIVIIISRVLNIIFIIIISFITKFFVIM